MMEAMIEATKAQYSVTGSPGKAAAMLSKLAAFKAKAAAKGFGAGIEWTTSTTTDIEGNLLVTVEVTTTGMFHYDGGWKLAAVAVGSGDHAQLVHSIGAELNLAELDASGEIDMRRCDHCGKRILRTQMLVLRSDDGQLMQVGGTCAKDFLGHDPSWALSMCEAVSEHSTGGKMEEWPLEAAVAAAIDAYVGVGYRKSSEPDSNREVVLAILTDTIRHKHWKEVRIAIEEARKANSIKVEEVINWMLDAGEGEFGSNMARLAQSKTVGPKVLGFIAYAPAGFDRWREKMAVEAARRAAENERRETALSCPNGKFLVEGVVTTVKVVDTAWGKAIKIRVMSDEGWCVWGTAASNLVSDRIARGDRVSFIATLSRSDNDETFGFFSRPTKARIVERALVNS